MTYLWDKNTLLSILLAITLSFIVGCGETRKGPYLVPTGNNTEMTVHWQLYETAACTIEWGTDGTNYPSSATIVEDGNSINKHQYAYTVTDLTPGTKYYYNVTVNTKYLSQTSFRGSFFTSAPTDATTLSFMAYGDSRSGAGTHDTIAGAIINTYTTDPSFQTFMLATGDLVLANEEIMWDLDFFNNSNPNVLEMLENIPVISCMGNHETYAGSNDLFTKYFPFPYVDAHYWSFDYGPAHFVIVDQYAGPEQDGNLTDDQLIWIESDLSSTSKPWKFICLHEPGYSAGGGHANSTDVQDNLQPLCEAYGVDIVFAGHNHYYARAEINGVQHITTGGGGASSYVPETPAENPDIIVSKMASHFCKIEIDGLSLDFTAVEPDGSVIDDFSLTK